MSKSAFDPSVGDRVCYSARFLASIQASEYADREGTVVAILQSPGSSPDRIRVEWDDEPGEPTSALAVNLARPKSYRAVDPTAVK